LKDSNFIGKIMHAKKDKPLVWKLRGKVIAW
jgi:hypothetical protein